MNHKYHWSLIRETAMFLLMVVLMVLMQSCNLGSSSGSDGGGWVSISNPSDETVNEPCDSQFFISGYAFVSPDWSYYPYLGAASSGHCSEAADAINVTGVTVTWENKSTGSTGNTMQKAGICPVLGNYFIGWHKWNASIPISLGENIIEVTATDPSGRVGSDSVNVYLQSVGLSISGRLIYTDNTLPSPLPEGMTLLLQDEVGDSQHYPDDKGNFRIPCLSPGTYNLTPQSSGMTYQFTPQSRTIVIDDQHILGADFATGIYTVGGRVVTSPYYYNPVHYIKISGINGSLTKRVSQDGNYYFTVPSGSYRVAPITSTTYSYSPTSRSVTVTNRNVFGIDFSATTN